MEGIGDASRILREARRRAGLSQRELAARAHTAQSVVARIERGRGSPSVETLARLLAAAGFAYRAELSPLPADDPVIAAYARDIDRSLLRENLTRSPDERILALSALARFATESRRAGRAATRK